MKLMLKLKESGQYKENRRGRSGAAVKKNTLTKGILGCVVILTLLTISPGCMGGGGAFQDMPKRPSAPKGETSEPGETPVAPTAPQGKGGGAAALKATGSEEWEAGAGKQAAGVAAPVPSKADLIKEAGFDMIYPNFNKETGRQDPFVPVSLTQGPLDVVKRMLPEKFRVIGTAVTPSGQIAMIEVGEQTKIVREGDILENGSAVKSISKYDVVLEKDSRELRLTMFTRKRIAKLAEETKYPPLPAVNINDLYKKYLEEKYGEEVEGKEAETKRPGSFNEFLESGPGGSAGSGGKGAAPTGKSSGSTIFRSREGE